jgi:hypothetical protein
MSRFNSFKFRSTHLTYLVLLLLILGPARSSWCFQDGDVTIVPDTLITDCHSVPSVCVTSTNMIMEQGNRVTPVDCNECLDLSFEEISSIGIQDRNIDLVYSPIIAYIQFQSVEGLELNSSLISVSHLKRPLRTSLNLHWSIQSTVLII